MRLRPSACAGAGRQDGGTTLGFFFEALTPGSLQLIVESQEGKCEKKRQIEIRDQGVLLFLGEASDEEVVNTPGIGSQGDHRIVMTAEQKKVKVNGKKVTCKAATYDDGVDLIV